MLALACAAAALVLQDGRVAHVLKDDAAVARFIQSRVVELANAAAAAKPAWYLASSASSCCLASSNRALQ